jgi:hypothetical protein
MFRVDIGRLVGVGADRQRLWPFRSRQRLVPRAVTACTVGRRRSNPGALHNLFLVSGRAADVRCTPPPSGMTVPATRS